MRRDICPIAGDVERGPPGTESGYPYHLAGVCVPFLLTESESARLRVAERLVRKSRILLAGTLADVKPELHAMRGV
jgi:hypothetical protein